MLEGTDGGYGYFVSVDVSARTEADAATLAKEHAESTGCSIVGVEEVEALEPNTASEPSVLNVQGRSYFDKPE